MKRGHYLAAMAIALLSGLLAACGGSSSVVTTVTIAPTSAAVLIDGGSQQFSASVTGPSNTAVTWSVSGTGCSGSNCGTISDTGLYTAPSNLPSPSTVTVTATSQANTKSSASAQVTLETGIQVTLTPATATLGTNETINVTATVTGTTTTGVTWDVNGTVNGDSTDGFICVIGSSPCQPPTSAVDAVYYQAPAAHPTTQIAVTATSVADTSRKATATFFVLNAVNPVIASISPTFTAQGSVSQDVYVSSESTSDFFTTSTVLANGQPLATTFISTSLLRGRVPAALLQSAANVQIAVEEQNGNVSNSVALQVTPVRPAIISYSPLSVPQCPSGSCGPESITLDGGYFSPSTTVQFNGQTIGAAYNSPNQISVSLPGSDLVNAGLYQLTLTNPGASPGEASINVAVAPDLSTTPLTLVGTAQVGSNPSQVAIDRATGVAVVVNTGSNSISLIDLQTCSTSSCPVAATVTVGNQPTGVAVDPLRDMAMVVNQGDKTLSLVDLSSDTVTGTIPLPSTYVPVSIGENPLTGHAAVANQQTNTVTVVDLSQNPAVVTPVDVTQGATRSGGTGISPQVAIEPHLDWAIVTPGGIGAISAIDMSHPSATTNGQPTYDIAFTFVLTPTTSGIAVNSTTDQLLFTDPQSNQLTEFSLLNESVQHVINAGFTNVATAVNPLTNIGVYVNQVTDSLQAVDLTTGLLVGNPLTIGTTPVSVAIDPTTDEAVVVNQGDGSVSVVSLGTVRTPSIVDAGPARLFTSTSSQSVSLIGGGFTSGAAVRVDGTALPSAEVQFVSSRQINVSVPASLLTGPRILNLDVQNSGGTPSNIFQVQVDQAIPVGTAPVAVAVDPTRKLAIVTNSGSNTISLINTSTGNVTSTIDVGADPVAVDVSPHLGTAVVANNGDNTASLIDLTASPPSATSISLAAASVIGGPIAVNIDQDAGLAAIANQQTNSVSFLSAVTGQITAATAVDQGPVALAADPNLQMLAVLCDTQSPPTVDIINRTYSPYLLTGHITGANLPTGVALDPVNDLFLVADGGGNRILVIDPQNNKITQNIATGINPNSIAYNFQATEAVTANTASHTASIVEVNPNGSHVRALLPLDSSNQQSVAIDPVTNIAVVADQAHNQVLLVPLLH